MATITEQSIKNQITTTELEKNLNSVLEKISKTVLKNEWILKVNGEPKSIFEFKKKSYLDSFLNNGKLKFSVSSLKSKNSRKNLAKRIYNVDRNISRKNINILFLVLRKLGVILEPVKVNISEKEQLIQSKRKAWLKLRNEAEQARLDYKNEKGDFYKKNQ